MRLFIASVALFAITLPTIARPASQSCGAQLAIGSAVVAASVLFATPASSADGAPTGQVFSPVLLKSSYKIWHPRSTPNKAAPSDLSAAGVFTDEPYTNRDLGNPALNQAPTDVQGEMRLMLPNLQSAWPVDLKVTAVARSEKVWNAHTLVLRERLAKLRQELASTKREVVPPANATTLNAKADEADASVQRLQTERATTQAQLDKQKTLAGTAATEVEAARSAVSQAQGNSFFCAHTHWAWVCNRAAQSQSTELTTKVAAQNQIQDELKRIQDKLASTERSLDEARTTDTQNKNEIAAANASEPVKSNSGFESRDRLQAEINRLETQAQTLNGFVASEIPNVRCPHPLLYRATAGTQPPFNSLLGKDIGPELKPSADLDLRICVNTQSHLTQAYVFRAGQELYRSEIKRGARGRIEQIRIEDDKHEMVEDHHWFVNREGTIRYAITFKTDRSDFESVYTDVP